MPSKGSAHRAIVKGLPISASWQDLKVPPRLLLLLSLPLALPGLKAMFVDPPLRSVTSLHDCALQLLLYGQRAVAVLKGFVCHMGILPQVTQTDYTNGFQKLYSLFLC